MKKTRVEYTAEELERRKRKLLSKVRVNCQRIVRKEDVQDYDTHEDRYYDWDDGRNGAFRND